MNKSLKIKPMQWLRRRPTPAPVRLNWEEVFHSMNDGLIVVSGSGIILKMNPGAEKITGLSIDMVAGLKLSEAFPFNERVWTQVAPYFSQATGSRSWTLREINWQNYQGGELILDLLLSPIVSEGPLGDSGKGGWVLLLRDVTPLKKLEEELRRSDRLATAGMIASGLAHEIKNPLGGIKGAAQLLARKGLTPALQECLDIIIKETTRVDHLVSELLILSGPKPLNLQSINLNELLDGILMLQEEVLREQGIQLVREFDPSLPEIRGDAERLTQAFLNFIRNATQAMGKKGVLKVRTRIKTDFRIKEKEEGRGFRMVLIEIVDNGLGIAAEDLDKIFLPFFSTKKGGNGLGMAIAQGIIDQHEGILHLDSKPDQGTTVSVYLRTSL